LTKIDNKDLEIRNLEHDNQIHSNKIYDLERDLRNSERDRNELIILIKDFKNPRFK